MCVAAKDSLRNVAVDITKHALGSDATADAFNGVQVVFTTTLVLKREVSGPFPPCGLANRTALRPQHHRRQAYLAPSRKTRAVDSGKRAKCARVLVRALMHPLRCRGTRARC
jgi:hypothetical protein